MNFLSTAQAILVTRRLRNFNSKFLFALPLCLRNLTHTNTYTHNCRLENLLLYATRGGFWKVVYPYTFIGCIPLLLALLSLLSAPSSSSAPLQRFHQYLCVFLRASWSVAVVINVRRLHLTARTTAIAIFVNECEVYCGGYSVCLRLIMVANNCPSTQARFLGAYDRVACKYRLYVCVARRLCCLLFMRVGMECCWCFL